MRALRTMMQILAAATVVTGTSCGYFSNGPLFEGTGLISGRLTFEGMPASGALVFVLGRDELLLTSGESGSFSAYVEAGRDLELVVMWGSSLGLRTGFDLAGDGTKDFTGLVLEPVAQLKGRVNLDHPERAEVLVLGTPFVGRPDSSGDYSILLPPGVWDLRVSASGYHHQDFEEEEAISGQSRLLDSVTLAPDPDFVCPSGVTEVTERFSQGGGGAVDMLFIVDNSGSMAGKQRSLAESFRDFADWLRSGALDFHIAVVTTGMLSANCLPCSGASTQSCINETGESGRFQDRVGRNVGTDAVPSFEFERIAGCRVVDRSNVDCLYNAVDQSGIAFVGTNSCGYERGLAAMRRSLQDELLSNYNRDFLRSEARLAVIAVSDEEDCGEEGDVTESLAQIGGSICYYAAKGVDPSGNMNDPDGKVLRLEEVSGYATFLSGLKRFPFQVTFSAIVGVSDPANPETTTIEYLPDGTIQPVCELPGCTGSYCRAGPGTRHIQLAQMLGGTVETICQTNFARSLERVAGASTGFKSRFGLRYMPYDIQSIEVRVNQESVPTGWALQDQSINFPSGNIPKPYSLVEVRYNTTCPAP